MDKQLRLLFQLGVPPIFARGISGRPTKIVRSHKRHSASHSTPTNAFRALAGTTTFQLQKGETKHLRNCSKVATSHHQAGWGKPAEP